MDGGGVSDIPNNGIDNAGLETTPERGRKVFFPPRTSSTLTQVDLDILSAQANVKTGEQAGANTNTSTGGGDPINQVLTRNKVLGGSPGKDRIRIGIMSRSNHVL